MSPTPELYISCFMALTQLLWHDIENDVLYVVANPNCAVWCFLELVMVPLYVFCLHGTRKNVKEPTLVYMMIQPRKYQKGGHHSSMLPL